VRAFSRGFIYFLYVVAFYALLYLTNAISPTRSFSVPTTSMEPTIAAGDYVVVDRNYYRNEALRAGDVIVFHYPPDPRMLNMKRCVALEGQTVEIRDAVVYVDGQRFMSSLVVKRTSTQVQPADLKDPKVVPPGAGNEDQYGPVLVPPGHFFALGDYRDNSFDSRFFGFVPKDGIVGKVLYVYWSEDFGRIGTNVR
jgi:signal peptidase I